LGSQIIDQLKNNLEIRENNKKTAKMTERCYLGNK